MMYNHGTMSTVTHVSVTVVRWCCTVIMIVGPKRSTLQAMLANLESEDDMPALQSGAASPPRGGNNNIQELEQTGTTCTLFDVTPIIVRLLR